MQLKLIQQQIEGFRRFLGTAAAQDALIPWESQRVFQENWDLEAVDLAAMYDRSLYNSRSRRLWFRENYEPKRLMLEFLQMEPEFVRSMFRDLYNEEKSPEVRIDRFIYYCDSLLQNYKRRNRDSIENNHYHGGDYQMVFLYLAFRYPERYALYDFEAFRETLRKLGVGQLPLSHDPERYVKVTRTIYGFLKKDEQLMELQRRRLETEEHYFQGESLLMVYDFYRFVAAG